MVSGFLGGNHEKLHFQPPIYVLSQVLLLLVQQPERELTLLICQNNKVYEHTSHKTKSKVELICDEYFYKQIYLALTSIYFSNYNAANMLLKVSRHRMVQCLWQYWAAPHNVNPLSYNGNLWDSQTGFSYLDSLFMLPQHYITNSYLWAPALYCSHSFQQCLWKVPQYSHLWGTENVMQSQYYIWLMSWEPKRVNVLVDVISSYSTYQI